MAEVIVATAKTHPFSSRVCIVYPQSYPRSEISSEPHSDVAPQGLVVEADASKDRSEETFEEHKHSQEQHELAQVVENVLDNPSSAAIVQDIRESSLR
jgi:hypothetical protein